MGITGEDIVLLAGNTFSDMLPCRPVNFPCYAAIDDAFRKQ
jgi:hypothetical protein